MDVWCRAVRVHVPVVLGTSRCPACGGWLADARAHEGVSDSVPLQMRPALGSHGVGPALDAIAHRLGVPRGGLYEPAPTAYGEGALERPTGRRLPPRPEGRSRITAHVPRRVIAGLRAGPASTDAQALRYSYALADGSLRVRRAWDGSLVVVPGSPAETDAEEEATGPAGMATSPDAGSDPAPAAP